MDANTAVRVWIDGWARGWRDHDTEPISALYADHALFVSAPFRDPLRGGAGAAEYARWAFADEAAVELWFADPVVGDDRAAIPYWAVIRGHGGEDSTLAGIADVRFDPDGVSWRSATTGRSRRASPTSRPRGGVRSQRTSAATKLARSRESARADPRRSRPLKAAASRPQSQRQIEPLTTQTNRV